MSTTTTHAPLSAAAKAAEQRAFELEKAAVTSYEEGWDRWDGPIYPIGYVQCRMQEDGYVALKVNGVEDGKAKRAEVKVMEVSTH